MCQSSLIYRFILPDDAEIIKVSTSTLGSKGLFKGQNHTRNTFPVPNGPKYSISEPGNIRLREFT